MLTIMGDYCDARGLALVLDDKTPGSIFSSFLGWTWQGIDERHGESYFTLYSLLFTLLQAFGGILRFQALANELPLCV